MVICLHGKDQARAHGLTIEQDRARTANTMLAAHMSTREAKVMAQKIAQQQPRLHRPFIVFAINVHSD
jgi:hypothetical protein